MRYFYSRLIIWDFGLLSSIVLCEVRVDSEAAPDVDGFPISNANVVAEILRLPTRVPSSIIMAPPAVSWKERNGQDRVDIGC